MDKENLLAFPINEKATLKHLRQDMKDDWFYDAVRYEELLSNSKNSEKFFRKILRFIMENINLATRRYMMFPSERSACDIY